MVRGSLVGTRAARRRRRGAPASRRVGARARLARRRKPARVDVAVVDRRRRGRSVKPARAQAVAERVEVRPGMARVDVVGRHRRDAAEVVDARARAAARRRRGSGSAAPARDTSASRIRRAIATACAISSSVGLGRALHRRRPGAARKFCTMTSWMCPCARCSARIASRLSTRSRRVSPMPTRMPVVNGMRSSPGLARSSPGAAPAACRARGGAACPARTGAGSTFSSIRPEADVDLLEARHVRVGRAAPALVCGKRPARERARAAQCEVLDRARPARAPRACAR